MPHAHIEVRPHGMWYVPYLVAGGKSRTLGGECDSSFGHTAAYPLEMAKKDAAWWAEQTGLKVEGYEYTAEDAAKQEAWWRNTMGLMAR